MTATATEVDPITLDGHVTFEVGSARFAVPVDQVGNVVRRADALELPQSDLSISGRRLALVDVRGRVLPALDLRAEPGSEADVIVARTAQRACLVVDRVTAVLRPGALVAEPVRRPALPSYAIGVLRAPDSDIPILLVDLPLVGELDSVGYAAIVEPALGLDVLAEGQT